MKTNKILYQWDAGQKLTDCRGVFVDFVISGEVYRCDVVNGECIVPDELLQHPGKQTAYECMADNTLQEFVFSVVPRPLPPDYVYTPTEKLTFEGLVQKVDDTVADIIRRADSGEFDGYTPVKGKDYFTESEKNEMMQRVSDGAIGDFREVVDSATAGFNKNSSAKTNDYNTNAEKKVGVYDSNAAEKLKAYNDNHTEKMTAYDANAAGKTAEFDSHAAELQTEVNNLKAEGTTLRAEAGKQQRRIDALMKLNKGQTYDVVRSVGTSSIDVISGTNYISIDKILGRTVVWNQLAERWATNGNVTVAEVGNLKKISLTGPVARFGASKDGHEIGTNVQSEQKYLMYVAVRDNSADVIPQIYGEFVKMIAGGENVPSYTKDICWAIFSVTEDSKVLCQTFTDTDNSYFYVPNVEAPINVINLTALYGAGKEPASYYEFERTYPEKCYEYSDYMLLQAPVTHVVATGRNTFDLKAFGDDFNIVDGVLTPKESIRTDHGADVFIPAGKTFSYSIKCPEGHNVRFKLFHTDGTTTSPYIISNGEFQKFVQTIEKDVYKIRADYTSRTKNVEIKDIQITLGEQEFSPYSETVIAKCSFPELRSANIVRDSLDVDTGIITRNVGVVNLGALKWKKNDSGRFFATLPAKAKPCGSFNRMNDDLCNIYKTKTINEIFEGATGIATHSTTGETVWIYDDRYSTEDEVVSALSGATLHYELNTPTTEYVTVAETLKEWIEVDAGAIVMLCGQYTDKKEPAKTEVSFVRKLNEVT